MSVFLNLVLSHGKQLALLGTMYGGLQIMSHIRNSKTYHTFSEYPCIIRYGYCDPLLPLIGHTDGKRIISCIELFLNEVDRSTLQKDGFRINQMGNALRKLVRGYVEKMRFADDQVEAIFAIHYADDELLTIEDKINDTLQTFMTR